MTSKYAHLDKDALIRLLDRRDAEQPLGLVWERSTDAGGELDPENAVNEDFVALELDEALSHGDAPWSNLIIEGDNFDALRALRVSLAGKIRCIYIDPPYNTGNRDFVYNDRFVDKTHRFRHSLWLEFMYRRLVLAKDLLADDGVIFVSIDDNELFRLGMLMDRVFGEDNFIANVIWQKAYAPKNSAAHFSDDHEYVVVFARNSASWHPNSLPRTAAQDSAYKNPDGDSRGVWRADGMSARNYYSKGTYEVTCPSGRTIPGPPSGRYWVYAEGKFKELDADNRIWWGANGNNNPAVKRFLTEVKQGVVPQTLWTYDQVGHTQDAKKQLLDVLQFDSSGEVFSTPKPVQLMERILRIASNPGDTILDFFAGSGTLAQAVAKLNAEDGGNRKFILVSSTEATVDEPGKNLCRDVCAQRVRRVMGGYTNGKGDAVAGLGGGFAYLRTRRIPRHRLSRRLGHVETWHALSLMHALPLDRWNGRGLAVGATPIQTPVAYLADLTAATLTALEVWLANCRGPRALVYSWAPERLSVYAGRIEALPIPQTLAERFGR